MVDKIVQLIDKDGDNIYPVASVPHGASITMTDTDPGEGAALEADHYIGVYGDTAEIPVIGDVLSTPSDVAYVDTANIVDGAVTEEKLGLSYSTSEQATGMTWTDGKTIYKKTVDFGNFASGGMTVTNALPADSDVVRMEGYFLNGGVYMNADHYYSSGQWGRLKVTKSTGTVKIDLGSDYGSGAAKATFYYTKSS